MLQKEELKPREGTVSPSAIPSIFSEINTRPKASTMGMSPGNHIAIIVILDVSLYTGVSTQIPWNPLLRCFPLPCGKPSCILEWLGRLSGSYPHAILEPRVFTTYHITRCTHANKTEPMQTRFKWSCLRTLAHLALPILNTIRNKRTTAVLILKTSKIV